MKGWLPSLISLAEREWLNPAEIYHENSLRLEVTLEVQIYANWASWLVNELAQCFLSSHYPFQYCTFFFFFFLFTTLTLVTIVI